MVESGAIVNLKITSLGINGEGVAKLNGMTIFVDGALPNEDIIARIATRKKAYAKAELVSINRRDEQRIEPICSRYEDCGGCQIMHLAYLGQLQRKTQLVKDAFKHIGGLHDACIFPCIASPKEFFYRNKIQLPVSMADNLIVTGFYRRGSHEVIPYDRCVVHHESMENTVHRIRDLLQKSTIAPYSEVDGSGTFRHFIIRANGKGEQLIGLVTNGKQPKKIQKLAQEILALSENIVGVVANINRKKQNVILGSETISLVGEPYLLENLDGLFFKVSLESFFQVNLGAAKIIYDTALSFANISATSRVLDAYCGIGTISLLASRLAKFVVGTECVLQAVKDAQENARINNIVNAKFVAGKVEDNVELFKDIDVAFVNPPRKGLDERVTCAIDDYGPSRIVYISCNPATLARDVRALQSYKLKQVQPVDMFAQTMHVESIALLERK